MRILEKHIPYLEYTAIAFLTAAFVVAVSML